MSSTESYDDFKGKVAEEQAGMSKEEVMETLAGKVKNAVDLDNLPKQEHNWIRRGAVVSCEGANHPWHKHFLR